MRQMYSITFTLYLPQRLRTALGKKSKRKFLRFYFFMTPYGLKNYGQYFLFRFFPICTLTRSLPKTSTKRELILIEMRVFRHILQRRYSYPFSILIFPRAVLQFFVKIFIFWNGFLRFSAFSWAVCNISCKVTTFALLMPHNFIITLIVSNVHIF